MTCDVLNPGYRTFVKEGTQHLSPERNLCVRGGCDDGVYGARLEGAIMVDRPKWIGDEFSKVSRSGHVFGAGVDAHEKYDLEGRAPIFGPRLAI